MMDSSSSSGLLLLDEARVILCFCGKTTFVATDDGIDVTLVAGTVNASTMNNEMNISATEMMKRGDNIMMLLLVLH